MATRTSPGGAWQSQCQHFSLHCLGGGYFRAGVEGGCLHSGLGEVVQKKQSEDFTIDGAVLKSAQKDRLLSKGDQGKSII